MSLTLSEEQTMLRDSAHQFLTDKSPVNQLRGLRDTRDATGFSRSLWKEFGEMGFSGVLIPEKFGGMGLGHVEAGVVMEQIGHQLTASPFLASSIVSVSALRSAASDTQLQNWLPGLAKSDVIATCAVDEGGKHRPEQTSLSARSTTDGFTLDGEKTFVLDSHVADLLIVAARSAGDPGDTNGISLFLVPSKTPGVHIERTIMVDAHNAGRVRFEQVQIGKDSVLGRLNEGWGCLSTALDAGRVAAASELLGLADETFSRTLTYLKERRQFGKLIGEFQALQHRAAHLYCELELTRSTVIYAQQQLDAKVDTSGKVASLAKAKAGRTATLAVQEAVQMHGGIGMTDEIEIGFFMKRARVLQELFGDASFHLDNLARHNGY